MRLQKFMADCGIASRRKCEEFILEGRVAVNGEIVTQLGTQVDKDDTVLFDGKKLTAENKKVYIMLYKPDKVVSTASDPEGRRTVLDLVDVPFRLYPVGRLDYHTEGLILLVNDGEAAYQLTHPKFEIEKEYLCVISGQISTKEILKLCSGVLLDGEKTAPAKVKIVDETEHTTSLSVIIHEGKNRQVRRMFEAVGKKVIHLTRMRHGEIMLSGLKKGQWRYLSKDEIAYIESLK